MIEIKNLFLKYIREYYALYDINLTVKDGESVALVGKEHSGKTTLLRVLSKLEKFDKGEVYLKGIALNKVDFAVDIEMGYLPEKPVFFENETVNFNLFYVLKERKISENEIEDKINKTLINFNMEKYKFMKIKDLSLYEKYLISFVRLLLRDLELVLIDNIFETLKEEEISNILSLIKQNFIQKKVTTIVATSDENLLKGITKRFINFENGSIV